MYNSLPDAAKLKTITHILFLGTGSHLLLECYTEWTIEARGGNETFINSSCGIMGYTFEKWLRAKEEKLCIFCAVGVFGIMRFVC